MLITIGWWTTSYKSEESQDKLAEKTKQLDMNLLDGIQAEIKRVKDIVAEYEAVPNNAGAIAAALMKLSIKKAEKAVENMDTVGMVVAIQDLRGYEL